MRLDSCKFAVLPVTFKIKVRQPALLIVCVKFARLFSVKKDTLSNDDWIGRTLAMYGMNLVKQ